MYRGPLPRGRCAICVLMRKREDAPRRAFDSHDVDGGGVGDGGSGRWFVAVVHTRDRNRLSARVRKNVSHEAAHSSASTEAPPRPAIVLEQRFHYGSTTTIMCTGRSRSSKRCNTSIDSASRFIGSPAARSLPGHDLVKIVVGTTAGVGTAQGSLSRGGIRTCNYIDKHIIGSHTNYSLNILQLTGGVGKVLVTCVLIRSGAKGKHQKLNIQNILRPDEI
ncbi:hypothetical protein QTP88_022675 [Uroleucon formosanum]